MPWMIKGDRRKNIPKEVTDIWAESGWVLEKESVIQKPDIAPKTIEKETTK